MKKQILIFLLMVVLGSCSKGEPEVENGGGQAPPSTDNSYTDDDLQQVTDGFDLRRNQAFESLRGKALVRGTVSPPISSSGIPYYRSLSYSLIDFAAKCFWLDEQNAAANSALMENCAIYVDKLDVMRDGDSFYWAADELCRIVEYWGANGSRKAGLLKPETETEIYKMMWQWVKDQSKVNTSMQLNDYLYVTSADLSTGTWDVEGSENHHVQRFSTKWHFSKLLKEQAEYKEKLFDDGFTAAQHYQAWTQYVKMYLRERGRKGLFVEFGNDAYGMESLKGIYNFYDFGDTELKSVTGKFLDLFWATWSQEQIDGVSGGSKARVYQGRESIIGATHFRKLSWYYLGITSPSVIKENIFSFITSSYRMPQVVVEIALDREGRGVYEITQRRLGLAKDGYYSPMPFYRLNQTQGLVRYSYCTPDFIMGTFHCEALPEPSWTMISSQNRWLGVIFDGNPNSRIYPQCEKSQNGVYNQHWGVQSKGTMIVQKLLNGTHSKYAGKMQVWFSDAGLSDQVERNGWFFAVSKGAYVAVKYAAGTTSWTVINEPGLWSGKWLVGSEQYSPVIIEVGRKTDYESYQKFQDKVLSLQLKVEKGLITRTTIYGDEIKFYTDYSRLATINAKAVELTPAKVMNSPFVQSEFNTGVYSIKKGSRVLNINFNE